MNRFSFWALILCLAASFPYVSGDDFGSAPSIPSEPPALINLSVYFITSSSAWFAWYTNQPANSTLFVGSGEGSGWNNYTYSYYRAGIPYNQTFFFNISDDLEPNTTYHVMTMNCNEFGCLNSSNQNFTTLPVLDEGEQLYDDFSNEVATNLLWNESTPGSGHVDLHYRDNFTQNYRLSQLGARDARTRMTMTNHSFYPGNELSYYVYYPSGSGNRLIRTVLKLRDGTLVEKWVGNWNGEVQLGNDLGDYQLHISFSNSSAVLTTILPNGTITQTNEWHVYGSPPIITDFTDQYPITFSFETVAGHDGVVDSVFDNFVINSQNETEPEPSACGIIFEDTYLEEDLHVDTYNDSCIIIGSDDVTLDCQGHSITGPGYESGFGSGVDSLHHGNLTVKNCIIQDFKYGIRYILYWHNYSASQSLFENNTINNNYVGIASNLGNSEGTLTIFRNKFRDQFLALEVTSDTNITNNDISRNERGIVLSSGNNIINDNQVCNTFYDFYCTGVNAYTHRRIEGKNNKFQTEYMCTLVGLQKQSKGCTSVTPFGSSDLEGRVGTLEVTIAELSNILDELRTSVAHILHDLERLIPTK
ncbi:hypothetical protein KJ765_03095 [Candidatus Micrarchaeota archaeon]|nr:hypothetical protein [Candidatus Micrarchaeota archaeon]